VGEGKGGRGEGWERGRDGRGEGMGEGRGWERRRDGRGEGMEVLGGLLLYLDLPDKVVSFAISASVSLSNSSPMNDSI
jgi:hypothetical protein